MADTSIQITQGTGTNIDVANPGNGTTYRQLIAVGDPNATVAGGIANVSNGQLSVGATLYGPIVATPVAGATITANQGGLWAVNASIIGVPAVTANVSVQGTVPVSGTITSNLSPSSTLTAYQGASPWLVNASIIGTPGVTANLAASSTITAYQGTNPWLTNASIVGVPAVNASVQGIVPVSGTFWQSTQPISGTVTADLGPSSTITAYQGNAPWIENVSIQGQVPVTASIAGIVTVAGNFSVNLAAGSTVSANQIGPWSVTLAGNVSIGSISVASASSITAFQGGSPWIVTQGVGSTLTVYQATLPMPVSGSFTANIPAGATVSANQVGQWSVTLAGNVSIGSISVASASSITAFQGGAPWLSNVSVIGTVPVSGNVGLVSNTTITAYQGASPWLVNTSIIGQVPVTASIAGIVSITGNMSVTNIPLVQFANSGFSNMGNQITLAGGVAQLGAWSVTLAGNVSIGSISVASASSITAFQGAAPWLVNASIIGTPAVTANLAASSTLTVYQGTNPWLVNASIIGAHNVSIVGNITLAPITATLSGQVTLGGVNLSPLGGGWTSYTNVNGLASTTTLSAAAGKFGGYMVNNLSATPAYLQIFDTTGNVTLGLTTPNMIFAIPANPSMSLGLAANLELTNGAVIANGIKIAVTTAANNSTYVSLAMQGSLWYH